MLQWMQRPLEQKDENYEGADEAKELHRLNLVRDARRLELSAADEFPPK